MGKSRKFESWCDYGLFNNRLTGSFDIFRRKTKDMLGPSEDIADMFGATHQIQTMQ